MLERVGSDVVPQIPSITPIESGTALGASIELRSDGLVRTYARSGDTYRLTEARNNQGGLLRLLYRGGRIARISSGRASIEIQRRDDGRIVGALDDLGRQVTYTYDESDQLIEVKDLAGETTRYAYQDRGALSAIEDPRSSTMFEATYLADGRALAVRALRKEAELDYSDATTRIVDTLGRRVIPLNGEAVNVAPFGYDKPSNSLFIPPEFRSVNCYSCSYTYIGAWIMVGAATVGQPVDMVFFPGLWCSQSSGGYGGGYGSAWHHYVTFGDGSSTDLVGFSGVGTAHTYSSSGNKNIYDDLRCGCSLFSTTLSATVTVAASCPSQVTTMIAEYQTFNVNISPVCSDFESHSPTFQYSNNFKWKDYNGRWEEGNPHPNWGMVKSSLVAGLEATRVAYGKDIWVSSGYRCPHGNQNAGGVTNSYHMHGRAVDLFSVLPNTWTEAEFNLIRTAAQATSPSPIESEDWNAYPVDHHYHVAW